MDHFLQVPLIHGSGAADMDGYIPPELSGTKDGVRIFWQIAEYLSERGFVVLRYDKRGVGENATILNPDVLGNATVQKSPSRCRCGTRCALATARS